MEGDEWLGTALAREPLLLHLKNGVVKPLHCLLQNSKVLQQA